MTLQEYAILVFNLFMGNKIPYIPEEIYVFRNKTKLEIHAQKFIKDISKKDIIIIFNIVNHKIKSIELVDALYTSLSTQIDLNKVSKEQQQLISLTQQIILIYYEKSVYSTTYKSNVQCLEQILKNSNILEYPELYTKYTKMITEILLTK